MLHIFSRFLVALFVLVVGAGLVIFQLILYWGRDLPDYKKLSEYDPPIITRIYSSEGNVMAEYALERRIYVEYEQIPKLVVNAFLAAEDKNFFQHQGIDFYSIIRAAVQSAFNIVQNRRVIGGSTITQQVVKSFLLSNERTLSRKIKEAILAYRISKVYSKERIMELYLNQIFFGHNSYGVVAAAQGYFGKELHELTVADVAMLAALPKAPSSLNPFANYAKAKIRRNWVIERMADDGFINNVEAAKFMKTDIELLHKKSSCSYQGNFYLDVVKKELIQIFGEEALYTKGLIVNTYFNEAIQKKADAAFASGLKNYDQRHGWHGRIAKVSNLNRWQDEIKKIEKPTTAYDYYLAVILNFNKEQLPIIGFIDGSTSFIKAIHLQWVKNEIVKNRSIIKQFLNVGDVVLVSKNQGGDYKLEQIPNVEGGMVVMEPYTGRVLSIIGGYDFTRSSFNRAVQAKRQPGSTFKPFVYLSALLEGYPPNAMLLDDPIAVSQGPGLPDWKPKNFGDQYLGLMTLRTALEKSRNIPTIRIVLEIGAKKIIDLAKLLNIYQDPDYYNSIALGAAETTLLDITNAYNMLASNGIRTKPRFIDSVYDRRGNLLYKDYDMECLNCNLVESVHEDHAVPEIKYKTERVLNAEDNYQMVSLLNGVATRGTAARSNVLNKTLAGKTGTTNNSFDTWFVGFTPYITAGVFIGYDTPKDMGRREGGASVALPVFTDFMQNTINHLPDEKFRIPEGIYFRTINKHNGMIIDEEDDIDSKDIIVEAFKQSDFTTEKQFLNDNYQVAVEERHHSMDSIIEALDQDHGDDDESYTVH